MALALAAPEPRAETESQRQPLGEVALDFDAVYAEHFAFVWRNLRRLGVADSSLRDAAQEVFLVVHRRGGNFELRGTIRSWIYSILRRVAAAHHRKSQRLMVEQFAPLDDLVDETMANPERHAERGQELSQLLALLALLDDDKRDALLLVDLEGMSAPEACLALDVNINTLYARLRAARQQMRRHFEEQRASDGSQP